MTPLAIAAVLAFAVVVLLTVLIAARFRQPEAPERMGLLRRAFDIAVLAVAIVPLVLLVHRIDTTHAGSLAGFENVTDAQRSQTAKPCVHRGEPGTPKEEEELSENKLWVTVSNADIAQDTITVNVALCISDQTLRHIETHRGRKVLHPFAALIETAGASEHPSRWLGAAFRISFNGVAPPATWESPIPTATILKSHAPQGGLRAAVALGTVTLPVLGAAHSYPLDSYEDRGTWEVSTPPGTYDGLATTAREQLPLRLEVAAPATTAIAWHSHPQRTTFGAVQELAGTRSFETKLFILVLLLLPIALFLGVLSTIGPSSSDLSRPIDAGLLAGVAAFLIAILPIRAVLVPADVAGLTVVDFALGTEITAMVAATLVVAVELGQRAIKRHRGGPRAS
jgi:hypothetical protein